MTTKINGTNTAASPAITGADTDTGLSFGSDTVNINTGGTTRATVDNSKLQTFGDVQFEGNDGTDNQLKWDKSDDSLYFRDNVKAQFGTGGDLQFYHSNGDSFIRNTGGFLSFGCTNNADLKFVTNNTERMRIQAGGNVLIGDDFTSNTARLDVFHTGANGPTYVSRFFQNTNSTNTDHACIQLRHNGATSGNSATMIDFKVSGGHSRGSIKSNSSSTSFNTTSDYRLKENVVTISDGITRLKTLKPSRFNFLDTKDITVDGFIAHEVTAVPEAITGTKDEVDADKNPVYQGIDQSKLVPLLTAALQEAITKIETLETKVAALEAA